MADKSNKASDEEVAQRLFNQWQQDSGLGQWFNPAFGGWKLLVVRIASALATAKASAHQQDIEAVEAMREGWQAIIEGTPRGARRFAFQSKVDALNLILTKLRAKERHEQK